MSPEALQIIQLCVPEYFRGPSGVARLEFWATGPAINKIEALILGTQPPRGGLRRTSVNNTDWVMSLGPVDDCPLWDELVDYAIKAKQLSC
jgi:hypothetical protein